MNKNEILAQIAAALNSNAEEDTTPKANQPVRISNLRVVKFTNGSGDKRVEGFCAEQNCNVTLNQAAVDALEASPLVKAGAPEPHGDTTRLPLRGVVVLGNISNVRVTEKDGYTNRNAYLDEFIELQDTSVKVTKWDF